MFRITIISILLLIITAYSLHIDPIGMDIIKKGVVYDATSGAVKSCLFCKIATREEPGTVVYEDTKFIVFKTINPASNRHLLVTPKKHIQNLESLSGPVDAALVREMIKVGSVALGDQAEGAHYSFHVPPFNSIDHLHLHAIGTKYDKNLFLNTLDVFIFLINHLHLMLLYMCDVSTQFFATSFIHQVIHPL